MRIEVDLLKCESNGFCVATAPDVFALTDDDELVLLTATLTDEHRAAVETAVMMCPKQALQLVEGDLHATE
jgi:ferredoxin